MGQHEHFNPPPPLAFRNSEMLYLPCFLNSKIVNPHPFQISELQPSGILVWNPSLTRYDFLTKEILHLNIFPEVYQLSAGLEITTKCLVAIASPNQSFATSFV